MKINLICVDCVERCCKTKGRLARTCLLLNNSCTVRKLDKCAYMDVGNFVQLFPCIGENHALLGMEDTRE